MSIEYSNEVFRLFSSYEELQSTLRRYKDLGWNISVNETKTSYFLYNPETRQVKYFKYNK